MAEDDDIDILGDFNLDSFLSKSDTALYENSSLVSQNSDLLKCDYTIHPQWLLDRPSTNPDCWYDPTLALPNEVESLGHVSTENSITDESGWTEKEKSLLERGIEIFGKSHVRLAQFIGSKTPAEIKYYLKNFYSEAQTNYGGFSAGINDVSVSNMVCDILDETQIPASIEEVIAAVSTAKSTAATKRRKTTSCNSYEDFDKNEPHPPSKSQDSKQKKRGRKNVKFKIKTQLKFPMSDFKQKTIKVMNETKKIEITTGNGLAVPICEGEEIVKIVKEESDSDLEIDIEDEPVVKSAIKKETTLNNVQVQDRPVKNNSKQPPTAIDLSAVDDFLLRQLTNMDVPKCEVRLNENFISELEKLINGEFFEGRPTKTPVRYLKIRNYIINTWLNIKPTYVTKTSIRQGLKNCGDVNCISRIHNYLEQIGAINFGCQQTKFERPLINVFGVVNSKDKERKQRGVTMDIGSRQRMKRKTNEGQGGRTLTHNEQGEVINTTIVSEDAQPKVRRPPVKPIRLIYCRPFNEVNPEKFKVKMSLTTLLLLDFHAHTSLTEVMGLVGGKWNRENRILTISHYEPCKNLASSSTHCDMCPVSQSKSAENIQNIDLKVLGWFHSHPTFAPEPSQQDLDTQKSVQLWMGSKVPCLGIILSPFSAHGALIASPFRCLIVGKKDNFEDQSVPYKFNVEVITEGCDFERFYKDFSKIYNGKGEELHKVNFKEPYFQDISISYLEKYITSVRMHLAKCGTLNKMTCDNIIERIVDICKD